MAVQAYGADRLCLPPDEGGAQLLFAKPLFHFLNAKVCWCHNGLESKGLPLAQFFWVGRPAQSLALAYHSILEVTDLHDAFP